MDREAVGGDMFRTECQQRVEVAIQIGQRLVRYGENKIERQIIETNLAHQPQRAAGGGGIVDAAEFW